MESFAARPESIKIRIRRNQRKAMSVGIFYWVGVLLLLCFSIFPYVSHLAGVDGENGELWIITFIKPITSFLSASKTTAEGLLTALVSILYILGVVISFVAAIVSTTRLFRITKRNPTNKWGYNRAAKAMRTMGKCFSLTFFCTFAVTVLAVLLLDGRPTLFFYLAFAVGIFFHFVGNFRGCKVSFFEMTEDRFNPVERKRTLTRKVSVGRNLCQFASTWLVILLLDKLANNGVSMQSIFKILEGGQLSLLDEMIIPVLLLVVLGCLLVAIGHAVSSAEYSADGEKAKGMKNCRRCACVIAVVGLIASILALISPAVAQGGVISLVGVFFVGLQWVFAEQAFANFASKQEALEEVSARKEKVKKEKVKKSKNKKEKVVEETAVVEVENTLPEAVEETAVEETAVEEVPVVAAMETKSAEERIYREPTYFVPDFLSTPNFELSETKTPAFGASENATPDFTGAFSEMKKDEKEGVSSGETIQRHSDEDIDALRKRWMTMQVDPIADHSPTLDTRLLSEQQVHCPGCNKLLHVRFGWTKAKCSNCGVVFEMKKRGKGYHHF